MKNFIAPTLLVLLFSGCASIMDGSTHTVAISSSPSEAKLEIRDTTGMNVHSGLTPASVSLQKGAGYFKKREYVVEISKPGYQKQIINLTASPSGWYIAGNLLIGGLIGWLVVDPVTGAMWTLKPDNISASMQATTVSANELKLNVALLNDLTPQQRTGLVSVN